MSAIIDDLLEEELARLDIASRQAAHKLMPLVKALLQIEERKMVVIEEYYARLVTKIAEKQAEIVRLEAAEAEQQ